MKKILLVLTLFHTFIFGQENRTYTHKELNWLSHQLTTTLSEEHRIGVKSSSPQILVCYLNWQWNYSQIPTEAVLNSVNIKFKAHNIDNVQRNLHTTFHLVESNWDNIDFSYYSNQIRNNNNRLKYDAGVITSNSNGYITFDRTLTSGPLFDAIQSAISSGDNYLTMGLRDHDGAVHYWQIYPADAQGLYTTQPSVDLTLDFTVVNPTVTLDQKLSTGTRVGTLKKWEGSSFGNPITPGASIPMDLGSVQIIQGTQGIYSNEKYNNWNNLPDVTNHHEFLIDGQTDILTANLNKLYSGVTIRTTADGNIVNGNINFKDPWFVDYPDPAYGNNKRNRGMSAPFISRTSPFSPDISTSFGGNNYKGVFLGENPNPSIPDKPYYSVRAPLTQDIYLSQTNKTHKFYFQNWTTSGASTQQVGSNPGGYDQKAVVFTSGTATVNANLKGTQLSNNASAFANSSQRKLVKTKDNWMHQVYESMGRVWLEHSTDNGATWFLGNNGQPLDNGAGKCPSIDWHYNTGEPNNPNFNAVVVVYQEPYSSTYKIQYAVFKYTSGSYVRQPQPDYPSQLYTEPAGGDSYASANANPNIAWGDEYRFTLTFERKSTAGSMQPGIYWISGMLYESGLQPVPALPSDPVKIIGTSASSTNAAVSLNKLNASSLEFNVVYQTAASAPANITNVALTSSYSGGSWSTSQTGASVISNQTGYLNTKPSLVQMPDNEVRVAWIRNLYGSTTTPSQVNVVFWNSASPSVYTYSGNGVNSVSLNIKDGTSSTYYAYAQNTNNTNWQNFASNNSGTITLNTTGRDIQLSNGSSSSNMYASSFYPASLPYYFLTTNSLGSLAKSGEEYTYGRGVVLGKDEMEFSYSIKSLTVDKVPVKFVEIPEVEVKRDTLNIISGVKPVGIDSLNTLLISEPFTLQEGASINLSEDGGFNTSAGKKVSSEYYVNCKVELVEDGTNKSLGVIKEIMFTPGDKKMSELKSSKVKINDKEGKSVRLKITLTTNAADMQGMFVNEYNTVNEDILSKLSAEELTLQGEGVITTYALDQNYPNPFNPATTIRYQIPQEGIVTIKIYDALGSEVMTLINEYKTPGSYNAVFNASNLSSGVYFYKINVNDYSATKKLILMK